jgi:hypothetical protein
MTLSAIVEEIVTKPVDASREDDMLCYSNDNTTQHAKMKGNKRVDEREEERSKAHTKSPLLFTTKFSPKSRYKQNPQLKCQAYILELLSICF